MAANPITTPQLEIKTQEKHPEVCKALTLKQRIEQLLQKMFAGHRENYFDGF